MKANKFKTDELKNKQIQKMKKLERKKQRQERQNRKYCYGDLI